MVILCRGSTEEIWKNSETHRLIDENTLNLLLFILTLLVATNVYAMFLVKFDSRNRCNYKMTAFQFNRGTLIDKILKS